MGISDLYNVLKEWCKDVLVPMHMSKLAGLKIAVDISIFLNKFVKTAGPERWLDSFILLLCTLKRHGIKPVCIFDGPNPPPEKKAEQERRRKEAAKKQDRISHGKKLLKRLETEFLPGEIQPDEEVCGEVKAVVGTRKGNKVDAINYDDIYDMVSGLKAALARQEKQNLPILPEYSTGGKEIISLMGFPYFQAEGEAEALCAAMCCAGLVDAVLTEDTDVLAYGAPFLLSKIDLTTQTVTAISHQAILNELQMTTEEFRDLCILLGCDYNERIKGFPPDGKKHKKATCIGYKGAFAMISEYRRLEEAEKYMVDPDPLIYRRCREIFTPPEELPNITIPYNKPIDKNGLIKFLAANKIRIGINYILDTWKPVPLTFHSGKNDDDEEILTDEEDDQALEAISEHDEAQPNEFLDQETEDLEGDEDVFGLAGEDTPI
jgi:flap endonuclease-1